MYSSLDSISGGRGCLGEGRLGVPGQVWEFSFLPSPSDHYSSWHTKQKQTQFWCPFSRSCLLCEAQTDKIQELGIIWLARRRAPYVKFLRINNRNITHRHATKCASMKALKTVTSLNKEARLPKFHFSQATIVFGTMNWNAQNAMIARIKQPPGPPNTVIAKGRNRGKTPNATIA